MSRSHEIRIGGLAITPHMSGAAYIESERTLLVADLHLEQGAAMARRGLHLPPYDTLDTLTALEAVITETQPWRLILLGDSFHDAVAHQQLDPAVVERLQRITALTETIWISGNHDPEEPRTAGGFFASEVRMGDVVLRHIPSRRAVDFEIAGHLHPGASIAQRGIHVRAKCFIADERRLILPAFGRYTGAVNVRQDSFSGLFLKEKTHVWVMGRDTLHRFPYSRTS